MEYDANIGREYDVNIARDLVNAPKGLRLWSPLFGQCRLDELVMPAQGGYNVKVSTVRDNGEVIQHIFGNDGRYFDGYARGECMLFPDECVRWNEWQYSCFRRSIGYVIVPIEGSAVNHTFLITSQDSCVRSKNPAFTFELEYKCKGYRYATPAETEGFFRELAQAGYEWDTNTMKLVKLLSRERRDRTGRGLEPMDIRPGGVERREREKDDMRLGTQGGGGRYIYTKVLHPKYKPGDRIVAEHDGEILIGPEVITEVLDDRYVLGDDPYPILLIDSDSDFRLVEDWELTEREDDGVVDCSACDAFNAPHFRPFDHVLGRHDDEDEWQIDLFDTEDPSNPRFRYGCFNNFFSQCIPYNEETKHLHRTTCMPDEKYIIWED